MNVSIGYVQTEGLGFFKVAPPVFANLILPAQVSTGTKRIGGNWNFVTAWAESFAKAQVQGDFPGWEISS